MKKQLILVLALISLGAFANDIQGTLMLKGSLKTKVTVNGVPSVCRLKVEKVKNLLEEDSFGNPGYQARVKISLDGHDLERDIKVKLDKDITVINLHLEKGLRRIKDLEYISSEENIKLNIDSEGRIVSTIFPYQQQTITCNF
jgi:hypothetical protein